MGPGGLRFTLDREIHLPKPADGVEELGVREADDGVRDGLGRYLDAMERATSEKHTSPLRRQPGRNGGRRLGAVLDPASLGWRGVNTTPDGLRLLHDLRRCLLEPPPQIHPAPRPPTAPPRTSEPPPNLIKQPGTAPASPESGRHRGELPDVTAR